MISLRPVLFIIGTMVLAMAAAMLMPALADLMSRNPDWRVFLASAAASGFLGGALILANRHSRLALSLRQGFVVTTGSWLSLSAVGALPLVFSDLGLSYTDAFFESVSGLTTTGSTILVGLDRMPPGILLWRAILQWIGGVGIIVMGITMLPMLRVGGMQLFRTESSDRSEKALPRSAQVAIATTAAYLVLTVACAFSYHAAGMTAFEALCHAMTTVSTGGFSTSDDSIAHFASPLIEWQATLFMTLGALPFVLYIQMVRGRRLALWQDSQSRRFLVSLVIVVLATAAALMFEQRVSADDALRLAAFNVVSVVTTTGFATADYTTWGTFAVASFFILTFAGGCTGSTAGGIKMMRFELMAVAGRMQFLVIRQPRRVTPLVYNERVVSYEVMQSAIGYVFLFFLSFVVLALALTAIGLDFETSLSGAVTALANVGPGVGPVIGPAGNFSSLPDAAKWLLSGGMLLGRLEFFTLFVLCMPSFWRG